MNANIDGAVAPLPRHDAPKNGDRADTRLLAVVDFLTGPPFSLIKATVHP
jgi:hypothetical protein